MELVCPHVQTEALYEGLLSRCRACHLVRTAQSAQFAYEQRYFTDGTGGGYNFDAPFAQAHDAARFVPELEHLERRGLKGSVLDIGCATGSFLLHAKARGWSVAGVELAEYGRQITHQRVGADIAASMAELPANATYDVVTLHHVLEHIPEPLPFLRNEVRPRVGKRLLVEVPNFGSLGAKVHGPRWRDLRVEQHLFHYTRQTLPVLLRQAGFEPVRVATLWEPLWSLRTGLDLLQQLAGALGPKPSPRQESGPAAVVDVSGYVPPKGTKKAVVELTRVAFRPLVAALERAGFGERLLVEAEVAGQQRGE